MLFNSIGFLIFFPLVTILYFLIPHKFRWVWLLITSYYFYMCWNPKYAILLGISTIITYISGLLIGKVNIIKNVHRATRLKKIIVFASFASNLGILFTFKYLNFFLSSLNTVLLKFHILLTIPTFDFLLPAGISFYTFQALSYTMDVYRGDIKPVKNLGKYALFVSFFPQLVAGPIEKSKDLLYQFNEKHYFDYDRVKNGLLLMLWGFVQKVLIADRLALLVNTVYDNPKNYKGFEIIIATVFFAFQIYCDFSSYSDIARGSAEVMGFRLSKNFESPYFSKSIKEFWRRWHITLSGWFKDYLYFPLGGNRCSKLRNYFNIMVVFIASGLWHGAAINFVIWGGLHGIYQVLGDLFKPVKEKLISIFKIKTDVLAYKVFQALTTFILVDFAWIFFRSGSFTYAKITIKNMMTFNPWVFTDGSIFKLGLDEKDFLISVIGIFIVLAINAIQSCKNLRLELAKQNLIFKWSLYLVTIISILVFGMYGPTFDVQKFIYFQF
ncbi:MBOAT family O-acyltransferase [Clostridium tagluense]|uniref:MBOAT family O-acyltransferase n=1 Tax=Clostridium tagluense TaxID=360422 RepID=UPI001CF264A6|nr:MBOAT family O-acyltransferase [Clostridium tagluense]MCB2296266.1 MBOAT family protein [Clostridium tagluense]